MVLLYRGRGVVGRPRPYSWTRASFCRTQKSHWTNCPELVDRDEFCTTSCRSVLVSAGSPARRSRTVGSNSDECGVGLIELCAPTTERPAKLRLDRLRGLPARGVPGDCPTCCG